MQEYFDRAVILDFFHLLNVNKINYMLIKNIDAELPEKLKVGKDVDILVHRNEIERCQSILEENGYKKIKHPQSVETGWQLLYGAEDCMMYKSEITRLEIDIHTSLCVKSTMLNGWCPLDKKINEPIWNNKEWDESLDCWRLDRKTAFVYEIARCVFDKSMFSEPYIREIKLNVDLLEDSIIEDYLQVVFFKFTSELKKLISEDAYASIVDKYYRFINY